MGGVLSETVCSLVAAHYEQAFDGLTDQLVAQGCIPGDGSKASEWVAWTGHVDDMLGQSKILCEDCVIRVMQTLLPEEVGYKKKSP